MIEKFNIAGYCRISVDEELDRDNTSIENQKAILSDFVKRRFPDSTLTFYEDRDRSGYTFEQREGYQAMRRELMAHRKDILLVKDFSRFSRRNSRGLVELEDLRDAGVRIISIGDGIDFPNDDDWLKIQFQFLILLLPRCLFLHCLILRFPILCFLLLHFLRFLFLHFLTLHFLILCFLLLYFLSQCLKFRYFLSLHMIWLPGVQIFSNLAALIILCTAYWRIISCPAAARSQRQQRQKQYCSHFFHPILRS